MLVALVWLGAYLLGAIPFGYLVARARGVDILKSGSGNIGATNVGRVLGKKFGVLVFLVDFAKGAVPVAVALALKKDLPDRELAEHGWLEVGAGLAAFLGHLFPIYLRFRGGKGVATGAGAVVVLMPGPALGAVLAWAAVVAATQYISLASLAAAGVLCLLQLFRAGAPDAADPRTLFCLVAALLVFVKHRANIGRLLEGTEPKIGWGNSMRKVLHVLALGLSFGTAVFFTLVVAPTLIGRFEDLGEKERPAWFPLPPNHAHSDAAINGPKEQGVRVFGYAVERLFVWYFLIEGVAAFIAAWTAVAWSRENPGVRVHWWRATLLLAALATVLAGWPLERHVADLREPRYQATDAYLREPTSPTALATMRAARAEFGRWHLAGLLLNFGTVVLLTGGMALAGYLPSDRVNAESLTAL